MAKARRYRINEIRTSTNLLINLFFTVVSIVCIAPVILVAAISVSSEKSIREFGYQFIPRNSVQMHMIIYSERAMLSEHTAYRYLLR